MGAKFEVLTYGVKNRLKSADCDGVENRLNS